NLALVTTFTVIADPADVEADVAAVVVVEAAGATVVAVVDVFLLLPHAATARSAISVAVTSFGNRVIETSSGLEALLLDYQGPVHVRVDLAVDGEAARLRGRCQAAGPGRRHGAGVER